ncbi:MAG: hypothetical protein LBK95_07140 [Bifidobacteriaceae bacterium]|jgi:hypothetical protein|nr:hypothetical protein [Bifidobacteriaceae bacterium]
MVFGTNSPRPPLDEIIRDMAVAELGRNGVTGTVELRDHGYALTTPDAIHSFANLTALAGAAQPDQWPTIVAAYVTAELALRDQPDAQDLGAAELRARIRTRLVQVESQPQVDTSYERPFAQGIAQILCIDYPRSVAVVTGSMLPGLALPVEELFRQGQLNTDAEPVGDRFQISQYVWGLEGDSLFVASKAAHLQALVPQVIGPAPMGVAFALPDRGHLFYFVLQGDDWAHGVNDLVQFADSVAYDPEASHPGGLISPLTYYWAPDGGVDLLGGRLSVGGDQPSVRVVPPPSLMRLMR